MNECKAPRPADCFQCQMYKIAEGVLSGRYNPPPTQEELKQFDANVQHQAEERQRLKSAKHDVKDDAASASSNNGDANQQQKLAPPRVLQAGVAPRMFKHLVCSSHPEFRTNRQQDALEFLLYFLDQIKQKEHARHTDPTTDFAFLQEERLQCTQCKRVRYSTESSRHISLGINAKKLPSPPAAADTDVTKSAKPVDQYEPVSFDECLASWSAPQTVSDYACPQCARPCEAHKQSRFHTFPQVLLVQMRRFVFDDWLPKKMTVKVQLSPAQPISLDSMRAHGKQSNEELLPQASSAAPAAAAAPNPDAGIVSQLTSMGFSENAASRACLAVKNSTAEAASEWLFGHMEDADINDPLPAAAATAAPASPSVSQAGNDAVSTDSVAQLESMGFDAARCRYALKQCSHSVERAVEWLFSHAEDTDIDMTDSAEASGGSAPKAAAAAAAPVVPIDSAPAGYQLFACITHLGASTQTGHYVAHVRKMNQWVQFNDNKVSAVTDEAMAQCVEQSYLLLFQRIEASSPQAA